MTTDKDNETEDICCSDLEGKNRNKKVKYIVRMRGPEEDADKMKEKVFMQLGEELSGRGNVVMTRLNDEDLKQIDALVEVELFKSRSEAVAFFIIEGIRAKKDLFDNVMPTVDKIKELKEQAKKSLATNTSVSKTISTKHGGKASE